jgi:hypothetical protein
LTIVFALDSCSTGSSATTPDLSKLQDTSTVKNWLTKVILDYTNENTGKDAFEKMRLLLTDNYYNYKQDAINLEYDNGIEMTVEQFHQKWKNVYDTRFVGHGGFFISTQDNGKISVPVCKLINSSSDTVQVYHVVIRDHDFKNDFVRDIKVVSRNGQLFSDDIKEYE